MRALLLPAALIGLAGLAGLAGPASAKMPVASDTVAEERLAMDTARRAATELGCAAAQLTAMVHEDLPPVTRDPAGRLTEGQSIRRFTLRGCEGVGRQNVLLIARPGQPQQASALLPGGTVADPLLQRDVVRPALTLATARLNRCQSARIVDTRLVQPGRVADGRIVSAWVEEWVARGCGKTTRIQVTLTPSPRGGTDYSLRPAE